MAKKIKKQPKKGEGSQYITRSMAIRRLQLSLQDVCIFICRFYNNFEILSYFINHFICLQIIAFIIEIVVLELLPIFVAFDH